MKKEQIKKLLNEDHKIKVFITIMDVKTMHSALKKLEYLEQD
jgi:hypothetical protein